MSRTGGLLLVNTNRETSPCAVMPIGALRVADACEDAGVPTEFLDLTFAKRPEAEFIRTLRQQRPKMIGLSVRNIDNGDVRYPRYYLPFVKKLVTLARRESNAPLIVGGPGASMAPENVRKALAVDTVVGGPGEAALLELWEKQKRRSLTGLPEIVQGGADIWEPTARYERWLDVKQYAKRGAGISVQSRRGCPFKCVYCNYAKIEGTERYDLGEVDRIIEQIKTRVRATGMREVEFVDSTFNSPPRFVRELCAGLAKANLDVSYTASGVSPRYADRETLQSMLDAGFTAIWCTPDTAAESTIRSYRKGFTPKQLLDTARATSDLKFPVMWSFIFGGPEETPETVKETLRFIQEEIDPIHPVMLTARLRIYPATHLAKLAAEEGYPEPVLDPAMPGQWYLSPKVDAQWLDQQLVEARNRMTNVMFMDSGQSRVLPMFHRIRSLLRQRGPLWTSYPQNRIRLRRIGLG
jgi:radical SAM superfamily enzyme YgiQ (UPF0313 family)